MRIWFILALLLYDVLASRFYDYDEFHGKHSAMKYDRRNWRKSLLQNKLDDHKDWDIRKQDYDIPRYGADDLERSKDIMDTPGVPGMYAPRHDYEKPPPTKGYEGQARYYDNKENEERLQRDNSKITNLEKDKDKMICEREHERYESCFAGCASITCDNPRDRLRPCYPFCEAGCICVPPYVRDDRTHKCVLFEDCTKGLRGIPDLGGAEEIMH